MSEKKNDMKSDTSRRKFLTGMAAAGIVSAGTPLASAAGGSKELTQADGNRTVAVIEGLLKKRDGTVTEVEIMQNFRIVIDTDMVDKISQVEDPVSGRPFVRMEIKEGALVKGETPKGRFSWKPKIASYGETLNVPFVMSDSGLNKSENSEFPLEEAAITSSESENTIFTFSGNPEIETRCIQDTCLVYTTNPVYIRVCDQKTSDINVVDDSHVPDPV